MTRTTGKELSAVLTWVNERTGLTFAWDKHNNNGYGILYLQSPSTSGISNQIAGNMWEGITKREACCILRAIDNLIDMGADFSAVVAKVAQS